jgi:osmoprotectant transport system permease protein
LASLHDILVEVGRHLQLAGIALALATIAGIPLGVLLARERWLAGPVLAVISVIYTIPSVALLGFMIPLLGIGAKVAIVALFLYALLPIVRNAYTGIGQADPSASEAARGMGMSETQVLVRVVLPQALPVLMGGIRTSAVLSVSIATLAALVGAGGLGKFVFEGIDMTDTRMILSGAIPIAGLALLVDLALALLERWLTPRGLRG